MSLDDLETYPLPPDDRPAGQPALDALARLLGGDLPEPYAEYLRTRGAVGIRGGAELVHDRGPVRLTVLYGLGGDGEYDVRTNLARYADRLPTGVVPVGEDAGSGAQLVLVVAGDARGTVATFRPDGLEPERPEDTLTIVAPDLATFLAGLRPDHEASDD